LAPPLRYGAKLPDSGLWEICLNCLFQSGRLRCSISPVDQEQGRMYISNCREENGG